MEDETNDALVRGGTALGDLVMERVHLLGLRLRLRHQLQVLIAPLGDLDVLSLDGLTQPAKYASMERCWSPMVPIMALTALL